MAEPAVSDTTAGTTAEGRLVGRQAELARILTALDTVGSGHGCTVFLFGEPGVGKTRLAREVLARAREQGAQVYMGRAFEQHTAVPFFPISEALTFKMTGTPLPALVDMLERWPELARLLPATGTERPKWESQDTQLRVFRAATGFFHALAEVSPLVLLLDDLHWADTTSLSLLLYLCRHLAGARILVLCTYRDVQVDRQHPLAEIVRELVRERLADEVHVGRLAVDETAALMRARLAGANVSDELVWIVHDRAEGNPFFSEELLKALVERGVVYQVQGRWEAGVTGNIEVPRSVRSVLGQRVSRLAPDVQELLRLASVVGQEFELDLLLAASGRLESDVLSQLDAALGADLLEERAVGNVERYGFAHALIQQTLYDELPNHRRRRLHRRVGEALETLGAGRVPEAAQLARHFVAARDDERATRYSIEAGEQAAARYAHAEAVSHYQVAADRLSVLGDDARVADVQHRLAHELYDLNRLADALSAYAAALRTYERLGDLIGQARVHHGIGRLEHGRYDMAAEVPHLDAALQLWPVEREDAELAWLLLDGSQAKHYGGDCAAASPLAERGLALAERFGDSGLLARALSCVSHTRMRYDPRPSEAITLLDRAERVARAAGEWRVLPRVCLSRAISHHMAGDLERALADRRRAVDAAERSGEIERLAFAYQTVADTCLVMGAWQEGRIAARAGLALDPQGLLKGMPGTTLLTWMDGRPEEALGRLRAYVADARRRVDLQGVSMGLAHLAELELQLDRPAEAEAPAREAAELMRVGGSWQAWPGRGCGPLAEVVVRVASPDMEDTLGAIEQMVAATEQYAARPQLLRARGLLLQRQGALDAALDAFAASGDVARSQHALIQLGRTLDTLAGVARQRGDASLAAEAEAELVQLVDRIGPEVSALAWARRAELATSRSAARLADGRLATGALAILTPREREVAELVARGLTNRQIAAALMIAEGTAGVHLDHILTKLTFRSRAQVAAWAVRHGLLSSPTS
jgi:DNA-binding CsgD family transcriptional regulator/tetratricopeptide (TPR) repeat protein